MNQDTTAERPAWRSLDFYFVPSGTGKATHSAEADGVYALKCPNCQTVRAKRRDSLAVGLHQVICVNCGFSSERIELGDGVVVQQTDEDHRGGTG